MRKKILSLIILNIFILFLTSCYCDHCPPRKNPYPCGDLIDSLQTQNVQVIQLGDTLRLILPVDRFFEPASTKVRPERAGTLREVALLTICHCYYLSGIRVTGYTDDIGRIRDQKQRTLQQARNIASYLWANGIPLERMHISGCGAQCSIASNDTPRGEAYNRRVEITLP